MPFVTHTAIISMNLYIGGRLSLAAPGRVVADEVAGRRLWIAPGSPIWRASLPDGLHLRDVPSDAEPPGGHRLFPSHWRRDGTLIWQPRECRHAVWFLFDATGGFRRWYVNLERRRDRPEHVDIIDHELDIQVARDRTWRWKDEASFEAKIGDPAYWSREEAHRIRREGETVIKDIEAARPPFDGRWQDFTPAPEWELPHRPSPPPLRLSPV